MANIVINDLTHHAALDRQAMASVTGGAFVNWGGLFATYESLLAAKRRTASGIINNIFNINRSQLNIQHAPQTVIGGAGPTIAVSSLESQTANVMAEIGTTPSAHDCPCCCGHL